jgi:hypothetical protein
MTMDLNKVLMESAQLDERLHAFLMPQDADVPDRVRCSAILCAVAFEHAESLKILLASGNYTSATGLLRLQYEAFVRAMWVQHAASDLVIGKMMSDLTKESAQAATNVPMLSEMLDALDGKVLKEVRDQLLEFKEYSWKPLNSFVHGGIHVIERHGNGYPPPLLLQLLRASNGVSLMTGMHLVVISGNPAHDGKLPAIQMEFKGCLPKINW